MTVLLFAAGTAFAQSQPQMLDVAPVDQSSVDTSIPVEKMDSKNDIPARVLFLKMGKVEEAKQYEIQIRPKNRTWVDPYSIKTNREKLRLRVTPGQYELRTRSFDQKNRRGQWLEWRAFVVPFRQPTNVYPAHESNISAKGEITERISFEWPIVPGAKAYRFKLYDENKKLLRHIINKQNWISASIDVGKGYFWSVQPLSIETEPENSKFTRLTQFRLSPPDKELTEVSLKLSENPKTIKYQFELVKMIDKDESSEPSIYESREPQFKARLAPGNYELRVRSVYDNNSVSGWGRPTAFVITIPNPKLITPINNVQIEPTDDLKNSVQLEWVRSQYAKHYQIFVFNKDGELVLDKLVDKPETTVELPHKQVFTWTVKALLPMESARNPAAQKPVKDEDKGSFAVDEYIKLNLGQSEEPSQLYAWSRVVMSNVAYNSENYDNSNRVKQNLLSSTAELAGGYWHRKTQYGGLLIAGVSGIDVAGNVSMTNQYSALLGYRKSFEGDKRLRVWVGPSIKETPEVGVSGTNVNQVELKKINTLGVSTLAAFMDTIAGDFGYQLYVGTFYGLQGVSTPNDRQQSKYLSYFSSVYLTHRWSNSVKGLLGYTFQYDAAGYKSNDRSGNDNQVSMAGNYLSLSIIWGLQATEK